LLQAKLKHLVDDDRELDNVEFQELWQILLDAMSSMPRVYYVVDGLDEMATGSESFRNALVYLAQQGPSLVKC